MNHNIIRKLKFVLSNTEANFKNAEANGDIHDYDIAFIAEPGNKDIYTHGIYMLKEIKTDIKTLTGVTVALDARITSNKIGIDTNRGLIDVLNQQVTSIEHSIRDINLNIYDINNNIDNFKTETNEKFGFIRNLIDAINTTAVTIEIVASLPEINSANSHTIYLVPSTDLQNNNIYTEYILQNNKWEVIGILKSELYLDQYLTKTEFLQKHDNVLYSINHLLESKANIIHSHNVEDITDFPTFKTINNESIVGSGNITILTPETDLSNYYTKYQCNSTYLTLLLVGGSLIGGSSFLNLGRIYTGPEDDAEIMNVEIPAATIETAGLMSANDKINIDKLSSMINHKNDYLCIDIFPDESSITLGQTYVDMGDGTDSVNLVIEAATHEKAGVMTAEDKIKLDALSSGSGAEIVNVETNVTQYIYYSIGSDPKQPDLNLPAINLVMVGIPPKLLKEYIVPNGWSTNIISTTDTKPYLWKVIFTCYDKYGNGTGENAVYNKILSSGAILAAVKNVGAESDSTGADWIYEGDWQAGKIYDRTSGKIPYVSYGYIIQNSNGEWVWTKDKPASDTVGYMTQYWYLSANTTETNAEPNESASSVWIKFHTDTAIATQFLKVDLVVANKVDTVQLNAVNARIDNLEAKEIVTDLLITTDLGNGITITIKDGKITFDAGDKGNWYLGLDEDGKPNWLSSVQSSLISLLSGKYSQMYLLQNLHCITARENGSDVIKFEIPTLTSTKYNFYRYTKGTNDPNASFDGQIMYSTSQIDNTSNLTDDLKSNVISKGDIFIPSDTATLQTGLTTLSAAGTNIAFAKYTISYCDELQSGYKVMCDHDVYLGYIPGENDQEEGIEYEAILLNICLIGTTNDGTHNLYQISKLNNTTNITNTQFQQLLKSAATELISGNSNISYNQNINLNRVTNYIE